MNTAECHWQCKSKLGGTWKHDALCKPWHRGKMQAMADMVQLTKHFKEELDCLKYDRNSENYCPVVTVGGMLCTHTL